MNLNISSWSIRNPVPGILLFILLTLAGWLGFRAMKIQNFPDMDLPMVTIMAALPGASPSQLENDVARKIENSLATVQGLRHMNTMLTDGVANIAVEFQLEKPVQEAVDDVRDAVARVRADLPADLRDPVIKKTVFSGSPILTYTVSSPRMDKEALSWFVDNDISKTLLGVPGVGLVARVGGATREVRIELDTAQLLALNLSAAEVSRQLRQVQQDAAGGRSDIGGAEQTVRTIASVQSAGQLAQLEIALADGRRIRLNQVAQVSDTVAEPRSAALLGERPVVGFEITRARGAGDLEVQDGVRAALEQLRGRHPDITITETINFVDQVAENYQGSMRLLWEGAALAVLVVFLFLRDWRATLVVAVALPLSVIPAFAVMHLMGFTLNVITLLSLSLVVGILVDDAIVEIENIARHLRMGKTPYQAAMEAADEIGLAVIATTFTLIAVFLPTAFMSGVVGKFFVQFGWTAAVAVFCSLIVARVLTPMMAAYLLKPQMEQEAPEPPWLQRYLGWAQWCLAQRGQTMLVALSFMLLGLWMASRLPEAFIPPDDVSQTQVRLTLPPGSTLADTLTAAAKARALVQDHPQLKMIYTAVGMGSAGGDDPDEMPGAAEVRNATMTLTLTHRSERPGISRQQIEQQLRDALDVLPGVRIGVGTSGSSESYVVALSGDDGEVLARHALQVARELRTIPGIGGVTSSAGLEQPELVVRPDFARAADLGVTSAAIAEALRVATSGDYEQDLARLNLSARQVPVVVRLPAAARRDLDTLRRLPVAGARGPVALENVATLELGSGPVQITRYDRVRNINLQVELNDQPLGAVEEAALALPSLRNLPPGVQRSAMGDAEQMDELASGFGLAMLTGMLCIYAVLVLLLKDFAQPVTIIAAPLLSIPGAFMALYATGSSLSMPAMIGLIMLMGIATKNSILLVDYIAIARAQDVSRWAAVVDACRKRVRPIVMTTIAMGAGMLPVALGWGSDPSFRAPMAIVVIGGLMSSTLLSLLVIPVVFTYIDDGVRWLSSRRMLTWRSFAERVGKWRLKKW
jgi:multidrug efflux pump subunit AcrB